MDDREIHRRELARLAWFLALLLALAGATYAVPAAEAVQPWRPGEPVPLLHLVDGGRRVVEGRDGAPKVAGGAAAVDAAEEPSAGPPPAPGSPAASRREAPGLPERPPAVPVALEVPPGALDAFFSALERAEAGEGVARVLHWGDSTIAGDGLAGAVRRRLQARFGDAGPGFLPVHVDPRWVQRPDVLRRPEGEWRSVSITFGGAGTAKYGLAGIASTAEGEASATLAGHRLEDGQRQLLRRIDVFYMVQRGGGTLWVKPAGAPAARIPTGADHLGDGFRLVEAPAGVRSVRLWTGGDGPVTVFGLALETGEPGVTWETLGVMGASLASFHRQNRRHLARQVARRDPALLVYMTGGNELSYPSLAAGEGEGYLRAYEDVVGRLRAGAPEASCLLVSPLDQAERVRGRVRSKPMLDRIVALQRRAARELGCAFWDARAAMGGEGGFVRFFEHDPPLAWTDLDHLTREGLDLLGEGLADAIEAAYDEWRGARAQGAAAGTGRSAAE